MMVSVWSLIFGRRNEDAAAETRHRAYDFLFRNLHAVTIGSRTNIVLTEIANPFAFLAHAGSCLLT